MREPMHKNKCVVALTTVAKSKDADRIATNLLKQKLVACVNVVGPIKSYYRWKGKTMKESEFLLVLKTIPSKIKSLESELIRIHPYELPEFVVLPVLGGFQKYLKWVASEVEFSRG